MIRFERMRGAKALWLPGTDHAAIATQTKVEKLLKENTTIESVPFYKPEPSGDSEDGYKSRIGIHEVLAVSSAIREVILRKGTSDAIETQAKSEGMLTMLEDGLYKAVRGVTSLEEVLRAVTE